MALSINVFSMACIMISDFVEETFINVTDSILNFYPFRQLLLTKMPSIFFLLAAVDLSA